MNAGLSAFSSVILFILIGFEKLSSLSLFLSPLSLSSLPLNFPANFQQLERFQSHNLSHNKPVHHLFMVSTSFSLSFLWPHVWFSKKKKTLRQKMHIEKKPHFTIFFFLLVIQVDSWGFLFDNEIDDMYLLYIWRHPIKLKRYTVIDNMSKLLSGRFEEV